MDRIREILDSIENDTLDDDTLAAYETELLDLFDQLPADTDTALLTEIADGVDALRAAASERLTAAAERAAERDAIAARLRPVEVPAETVEEIEDALESVDVPDETPDTVETPEAVEVPEPIAASAPPAAEVARRQPARTRPRETAPEAPKVNHTLTLNGREVTHPEVIESFADALNSGGLMNERARVRFEFPDELRVADDTSPGNVAKLRRAAEVRRDPASWAADALTASMWCSPADTVYDYPVISNASRPVRNALPSFQATRGRVQYPTPVTLDDIDVAGSDASVSIYTDTEFDAGTNKPFDELPCPSWTTYSTHAVTKRYRLTNMNELADPEHVANYDALVNAAHARLAEGKLLDLIKANSTAKSEAASFGASRDLLEAIKRAAAHIRSQFRSDTQCRVLLPAWAVVMGEADLIRALQSDPAFLTDATGIFARALADVGVNLSTYIDTPSSGTSQVLNLDAGAQLDAFPTTVQWGIWDEGHFVFLDRGTLDFGVVRDSTLNDDNKAEIFYESFEGIAKVGTKALWVSQSVCHDGTSGAGVDVNVCLGS